MGSLDSDDRMSMSLPIAKLVNHFKHSFRQRDFDDFRDILINRENSLKKEIENLKKDPHTTKQAVTLLDRNGGVVNLGRLQVEERLGKKQRECQRLKETSGQLIEEKEALTNNLKMVNKKRDMLFMENMKMENGKNKLISELGESKRKCQELEAAVNQLTEEKRMLTDDVKMADNKFDIILMENVKMGNEKNNLITEMEKSRSKCQELEAAVTRLTVEKTMLESHVKIAEEINMKMKNEKNNSVTELNGKINELKNKNLESERLAEVYQEKCRCLDDKIAKMDQEMEQTKLKSVKVAEELKLANKVKENLRLEKIEADKKIELYKSKFENLSIRTKTIEDNFAKMSTMKVGDMETLINDGGEPGNSKMEWNLDSQRLRGRNENSSRNANVDAMSPSGLSKRGGRNLVQRLAKEGIDDAHKNKTSCGKKSGHGSPQEENNEPKEPLGLGPHLGNKSLHSSSTKSACSSPAATMTVIDIIDSDDETNPNGVTHLVPTPQTGKRNRTNSKECILTVKRQKDACKEEDMANTVPTHGKENQIREPTIIGKDSSVQKLGGASDEDSEDECLSDSKMIEMVKNLGKKIAYESMLQTIQTDDEFCMSAVCALYRQHLSASKSKGRLDPSTDAGFSLSNSMRGCGLAMYLIDGDKELKMRKSVSEVKYNPQVINDCRKLANAYAKKLFDLRCSAADPFFRQS